MAEPLRQAGFTLKFDALVQPFRYDREIMVQVLINLLENSVKFGKDADVKEIVIRLARTAGACSWRWPTPVRASPTGDLKKIFNDFYRAENALTSAAGGTGIGLALVKRFVTLLGGRVSAANNSGAGCTIRIELPR